MISDRQRGRDLFCRQVYYMQKAQLDEMVRKMEGLPPNTVVDAAYMKKVDQLKKYSDYLIETDRHLKRRNA